MFLQYHAPYLKRVDEALDAYMSLPELPELLQKSMSYTLMAGGKRLRPCMTLAAADLFGGDLGDALPYACAIEMIHTYSLIHDDLPAMDNDALRRGKPTNHIVFGEGQAVLAGDGLLSYAFEILTSALCKNLRPAFARAAHAIIHGAGVFGMVHGQCLDLQLQGQSSGSEQTLHEIHRGKTAAMLVASVLAGAYCANAKAEDIAAMEQFGNAYGLLFQITDDLLDVEGSPELTGKSSGKDTRDGKFTFPSVYGIEGTRQYAKRVALEAEAALSSFGTRAVYFQELIAYTLNRKS